MFAKDEWVEQFMTFLWMILILVKNVDVKGLPGKQSDDYSLAGSKGSLSLRTKFQCGPKHELKRMFELRSC